MRQSHRETIFRLLSFLQADRLLNLYKQVTDSVTTLCLHRVADGDDLCWPPLSVRVFDELMAYVARRFEVIAMSELTVYRPGKRPALILSFDDGYADFMDNALPVLRKHGLPAIHNVVVDCVESGRPIWTQRLNNLFDDLHRRRVSAEVEVFGRLYKILPDAGHLVRTNLEIYKGLLCQEPEVREEALQGLEAHFDFAQKRDRMMGWQDLRECLASDVEIGSHTMTHSSLRALRKPEALRYELCESRRILSERLGVSIDTVAFPNGEYNQQVLAESQAAGYQHLLTADGTWLPARAVLSAPQVIPRIVVQHPGYFENVLSIENFHNVVKRRHAVTRD